VRTEELASFAKTKELKPGESQTLFIRFRIRDMASYCEKDACYRLDEGDYRIRIGNSSRHTIPAVVLKLKKAVVTEQLRNEYPLSEELHEISKAGRTPCRDRDLLFRVGCGIAEEMEEYGITMILGPSLNIHRDPLCGRNFEYFSEDPLVSGLMAAAITRGIQSRPGTGACIKHYAANNQESNRCAVDTIVSERALREIYLKGFEIAVKTAQPMAIMTSYNLINGVPTADSRDLNTDIARGEWGFQGLIMTDWNGGASTPYKSMHAGNDLIMPGGKQRALNIVMAVETVMPNFDDKGQIVFEKVVPFLPIRQAMWNSFTPKPDGKDTVTANLKEGYTAEEKDGVILVNGEKIHLNCVVQRTSPADFYMEYTDVTTDVAHVTGQGRQIVYRGNLRRKRSICVGDVQRCACHNLKVIMNSLAMYRTYPQLTPTPFSEHDRLEEWI
jgi:beta-glucosidase